MPVHVDLTKHYSATYCLNKIVHSLFHQQHYAVIGKHSITDKSIWSGLRFELSLVALDLPVK